MIDGNGKVIYQTKELDDTKGMEQGTEMFTMMGFSFLVWVTCFNSVLLYAMNNGILPGLDCTQFYNLFVLIN